MTPKGVERGGKGRPLSWATPARMLMPLDSTYTPEALRHDPYMYT